MLLGLGRKCWLLAQFNMGKIDKNWLDPKFFFENYDNLLMDWTRVFRRSGEPKVIPEPFSRAAERKEQPYTEGIDFGRNKF
jgi:hypothetical protein